MAISISGGDFRKTIARLERLSRINPQRLLNRLGQDGVQALARATPKDTGETAASWTYEISGSGDNYSISWTNSKMAGRVPLVILLNYGHGLDGGGWVPERRFIEPALDPIFDKFKQDLIREVGGL